jgi:hypothetical protein
MGLVTRWTLAALMLSMLSAAVVAASAVPAQSAPAQSAPAQSAPAQSAQSTQPSAPDIGVLTGIRTGVHPGFDRVVLDFSGPRPQVSSR